MMVNYMWEEGLLDLPMADGTTKKSSKEHCLPLFEALMGLASNNNGGSSSFAAGTRLDLKGSETIYIEHKLGGSQIARVEFRPNKVRASIANAALGMSISKIKSMADIAAAVWYAYIAFDNGTSKADGQKKAALIDTLYRGLEGEETDDFELALTNFEASAILINGPITGAEESLPVLDKKIEGPKKIISGEFVTFPVSAAAASTATMAQDRQAVLPYLLDSEELREYRKNLSPEQKAHVPEIRPSHVYREAEIYAYKVMHATQNDPGDLAVHVVQCTGPAATGKSQFVDQKGANDGMPTYHLVFCKSSKFDHYLDSWAPYLVNGNIPALTAKEKLVNEALQADTDNREAVEIAMEALGYPSAIEVKFDPDYAWDILGKKGSPAPAQEIVAELETSARSVIFSLKEKLEKTDTSNCVLGYKRIMSPLVAWFTGGGYMEFGEMATMSPGEMSKFHDILDFNRKASIMTAEGEVFRHPQCYAFLTNNLEYDEDHPLTLPMISRMSLDVEFPQLTENEATDRLVSVLGCEAKRPIAKDIVHAYLTIGKEATNLSLPGGLDFRNLKQIGNRILIHEFDARQVFEKEVIHHFVQHSDPESKVSDETALLGLLDELDLFRS